MIKLNWYALTKPHIVHRYYRMKEEIAVGTKFIHEDYSIYVNIPNKNRDRAIYNMVRESLSEELPLVNSKEELYDIMNVFKLITDRTSVTIKLTWNTK